MPRGTSGRRVIARCANCGSLHVSEVFEDGTVRPIGTAECACGEGELQPLE